jgi:hypothetical protein
MELPEIAIGESLPLHICSQFELKMMVIGGRSFRLGLSQAESWVPAKLEGSGIPIYVEFFSFKLLKTCCL